MTAGEVCERPAPDDRGGITPRHVLQVTAGLRVTGRPGRGRWRSGAVPACVARFADRTLGRPPVAVCEDPPSLGGIFGQARSQTPASGTRHSFALRSSSTRMRRAVGGESARCRRAVYRRLRRPTRAAAIPLVRNGLQTTALRDPSLHGMICFGKQGVATDTAATAARRGSAPEPNPVTCYWLCGY